MTATFADAERSDIRDAASGLIATITDCIDRHRELHAFIVEATESFRVEQDRQMFTRAASLRSLDLGPELVEPTLSLEIRGARRVLDAFTRSILGPSVPARPSVASLLDTLLRPITERAEVGEARAALEFVDDATPDWAFPAGTVELVDELLADLPVARRLSDLLREARARGGEDAADLIRLEALAAFGGRDLSRLAGGEATLASVDDGEILHLEGFAGADLLVGLLEPDLVSRVPVRLPSAASGPAVQLRLLPRREPTEKAEAAR